MDRLSELLADLAEAGVGGHTRVAVARRVAASLARVSSLSRLELGWCDARATRSTRVCAEPAANGWAVQEQRGPLPSSGARALATAEVQIQAGPQGVQIALPLTSGEGAPGYALLEVSGELPGEFDERGLHAVGRVLRIAQRNCNLIEKVAGVSRRAHARNADLRRDLERVSGLPPVVARSPAMRRVLDQVEAVAVHTTSVLLLGESGTGKSLLARRVHARSDRAQGPFVAVNCGALPESLIESELFGHAAGAFTGATRAHRGRFERAHGGTLFLDEVAELSLGAQVKLLRALQERVIEPLGSEREVAVDVRVVAATNRSLEDRVASGAFREDLFYRLSVFPVSIPPLRERAEDLPELVTQLLVACAVAQGRATPHVDAATLGALLANPWAGNVRELANVLERSLILSPGDRLELAAALPRLAALEAPSAGSTFEAAMRACLESALTRAGGKIYGAGGAAEALDLHPSTLQTKLRKLGIERANFTR